MALGDQAPGAIIIQSGARIHFEYAMKDVRALLNVHNEATQEQRGRPDSNLEVFKRSAVILAVTAWETFIEDTIRTCGKSLIEAAATPNDVNAAFNHVANSALQAESKLTPALLKTWTGDGWKENLLAKLEADLADLNTPKSHKIAELSKRYLGQDVTISWVWKKNNKEKTCTRLNELIEKRGALVHRGRSISENAAVRKADVDKAIDLLPRLVECTEAALGTSPRAAN